MASVSDSIKEKLRSLIQAVIRCHDDGAVSGPRDRLREAVNNISESERKSTLEEAAGSDFEQLSEVFLV